MTDRAFRFSLILAKLIDCDSVISFSAWYSFDIELVLVEVMKMAKEIRPDNKKREGRSGCGPGGAVVCWRMVWAAAGGCLAFWVPERQGGRARRRGDGLPGMAVAGNDPAAIRRYLISY